MRKVICVYLPTWPVDRVRRRTRVSRAEQRRSDAAAARVRSGILRRSAAILLVSEAHSRVVVRACCEAASAMGVCGGMALAHARALLAEHHLHIHPDQPRRDAEALAALARWATRLAPIVQVDDTHNPERPDGLILDVTGCERLYGGDDRMLAAIEHAIARLGVNVRLAMAQTVGAAWAMARYAQESDGGVSMRKSLPVCCFSCFSLPVAALRLDRDALDALDEVAIDTVGDLLAVPRRELFERFGDRVLRRIDQMTGRVDEPIVAVRAPDPPRVERVFAGPVVQIEAIAITVRELLGELAAELRRRTLGARRIVLTLERYEVADTRHAVTCAAPCADAGHLWTLWRPRVERMHMGHGVERVELVADRVQRIAERQGSRWADTAGLDAKEAEAALGRWLDTMIARLGPDRVCAAEPVETHAPHDAFRFRAFDPDADVARETSSAVRLVDADRPSLLHETPPPLEVVTLNPDGPLLSLRRDGDGEPRRVLRTIGPERIAGRWWLSPDPARPTPQRDYFKCQLDDGLWLWVYRDVETRRWFCQGEWA